MRYTTRTVKDDNLNSNAPTDSDFIIYSTAERNLNKYFLYMYQSPKSLSSACRVLKYITLSTFCDAQVSKIL